MKTALLALVLITAQAQAQTPIDWNAALEVDERAIADMMGRRLRDESLPAFAAAVAQKAEALAALGHLDDARMFRRLARHLGASISIDDPALRRPAMDREPLRVGHDVQAPVALKRVEPVYAEGARKARITGIVIIEAIIDKYGVIRDAEVLKGLTPLLDYAAVDAVRQWRFIPGRLNGDAVPVLFNLTINFKLKADEDETPRY